MSELQFVVKTVKDAFVEDAFGILCLLAFFWSVRWFASRLSR